VEYHGSIVLLAPVTKRAHAWCGEHMPTSIMQAAVIMNRRLFLRCLGLLATIPLYAAAQPRGKMYRIGFLRRTSREPSAFEAFRLGLRDLG
jgi:hypothetical protein